MTPYIQQVRRCTQCQRFGHTTRFCRAKPDRYVCEFCGQFGHDSAGCVEKFPRCVNCARAKLDEAPHRASDRNCPSFLLQKELKKIMAFKCLSPQDALEFYKKYGKLEDFPSMRPSPPTLADFIPLNNNNYQSHAVARSSVLLAPDIPSFSGAVFGAPLLSLQWLHTLL